MQVTKLGELTIRQFFAKHNNRKYTSHKYPDSLFEMVYVSSTNKIICHALKQGSFGKKTPVLTEDILKENGIILIENFEEGLMNL